MINCSEQINFETGGSKTEKWGGLLLSSQSWLSRACISHAPIFEPPWFRSVPGHFEICWGTPSRKVRLTLVKDTPCESFCWWCGWRGRSGGLIGDSAGEIECVSSILISIQHILRGSWEVNWLCDMPLSGIHWRFSDLGMMSVGYRCPWRVLCAFRAAAPELMVSGLSFLYRWWKDGVSSSVNNKRKRQSKR